MGLFSFLRGKGKKIGAAEAGAAPSDAELKEELKTLGLDEGIELEVAGDTVKLKGTPVSQEAKEKAIVAVGNIEGIAAVEDETPGDDPVVYTVESGDTLWAIAEKSLGAGNRYMEIFEANKPMLSDPDKIYPGQVLRIPAA